MSNHERFIPDEGAEKPSQPEEDLSIEGLQKSAEALRLKVAAAQAQREKDVEQKLTDRETLIGEAQKNDEVLRTAEETLEYFTAIHKLGELKDPADIKKLAEIRDLTALLEKRRLEIDKKIDVISNQPRVLEKLYDSAKKEDLERTVEKESAKAREELNPRIDQLANSVRALSEKKDHLYDQRETVERAVSSAWKKVEEVFAKAKNMLKSDFRSTLDRILRDNSSSERIKEQLIKAREDLGWLSGKEKAAVDFLLIKDREGGALHQHRLALTAFADSKQKLEATKAEEAGLAEQYKSIILDAWRAQDEINKLTGKEHSNDLPNDMNHRVDYHLAKWANIKHWEGGKQVGKYDGWHDANKVERNKMLSNTWDYVKNIAGGTTLIYSHPKEPEERE